MSLGFKGYQRKAYSRQAVLWASPSSETGQGVHRRTLGGACEQSSGVEILRLRGVVAAYGSFVGRRFQDVKSGIRNILACSRSRS